MALRTISEEVILGDFHRIPFSAQSLYFFLLCKADNYGFIDNALTEIFKAGYTADVLENLQKKGFALIFDENTVLITDWFRHIGTRVEVDPAREQLYSRITLGSDGRFKWKNQKQNTMKKETVFVPPTLDEVRAYAKERNSTVDPVVFYTYFNSPNENGETWVDAGGRPVKSWKQKFCTWERSGHGRSKGVHGRTNKQGAPGNSGGVSKWRLRYDIDGTAES